MQVQPCPSCGARYNVERLSDGATFECRRCGHAVHVGAHEPPPKPFSAGLLGAGVAALLGLLLYANPSSGFGASGSFGLGEPRWPWELLQDDTALSTKVTIVLWAAAGLWGAISALGIAPRSRSVLTVSLTGVLILMCTWSEVVELRVDTPLLAMLAMVALGAGLLLLKEPETSGLARVLAFGGGLLATWWFAFSFQETDQGTISYLAALVRDVRGIFDGRLTSDTVTHQLVPNLALLLAGLIGVLTGLGAGGRAWVGTGLTLLLVVLLLPALSDLVGLLGEDDPWGDAGSIVAEYGTQALVTSGFALWLLASHGIADLARNRKDPR